MKKLKSKALPKAGYAALVIMLSVATGVGLSELTERYPERIPWLVKLTASHDVRGYATHIRDGDTLEVSEMPIRLASLDCAELGSREGETAKNILKSLTAGRTLDCYLKKRMSYDRHVGSCYFEDGSNVGNKLIEGGYCQRY